MNEQQGPHEKLGKGEQKTHRQHWWSSQEQTKRISNRDPCKTGEGWTEDTQTTLVYQVKNKPKEWPTGPHQKLRKGEQNIHRQHCWSSQEQTKRMSNRGPIKNWGRLTGRHTYNIGDQIKNKLKEWATEAPSKTGKGWTEDTQKTLVIESRTN
jgi:hypothetical protein